MNITITRLDGGIHILPAPPYLIKYLRYSHRSFAKENYKTVNKFEEKLLHQPDGEGGIFSLQGFFEHVCHLIHKNYDTFQVVDHRTPLAQPDWARIKKVGLRDYQLKPVIEFIMKGMTNSGVIKATGSFGKTYCQAFTYAAWSNLTTILAIPLKQVFTQTYKKFVELFPEKHIGRIGDGFNDISQDITITTFKSLPKCAVEKCQLLLVDEIQSATGEVVQNTITSMQPVRMFGYTATDEHLFNGADKVLVGLFGERLINIDFQEALEMNAVVPGVVYFVDVPESILSAQTIEQKISQGIKQHKVRNQMIAKTTTLIPAGWQAIIFVEHIADHLVNLHKLMPCCCEYIHRGSNKKELGVYAMTPKKQTEVIDKFSNNEIQFLIATDAFKAGVDIPNVRVLIQASGGSSEVEILQEAFRATRILTEEKQNALGVDPKTHFVLVDFMDKHDSFLEGQSLKRMEIYRSQGWIIKQVTSVDDIKWDYETNFKEEAL